MLELHLQVVSSIVGTDCASGARSQIRGQGQTPRSNVMQRHSRICGELDTRSKYSPGGYVVN